MLDDNILARSKHHEEYKATTQIRQAWWGEKELWRNRRPTNTEKLQTKESKQKNPTFKKKIRKTANEGMQTREFYILWNLGME